MHNQADNLEYVFEVQAGVNNLWIGLGIMLIILCFGAAVFLFRYQRLSSKMRATLAMLFFFFGLLATGTTVFSYLGQAKLDPVKIYSDRITTTYGTAQFSDIQNARIIKDQDRSLINQDIVRRETALLYIEEKGGKVHVLSAEQYPVEDILQRMRELIKKGQQQPD